MGQQSPRIRFSEWLPSGVMVHFEGGETVFYPAALLHEQIKAPSVRVFTAMERAVPEPQDDVS